MCGNDDDDDDGLSLGEKGRVRMSLACTIVRYGSCFSWINVNLCAFFVRVKSFYKKEICRCLDRK